MFSIRSVNQKDDEILFAWANHPVTRQNSLNSNVIEWPEHQAWLRQKLSDPSSEFYMVEKTDYGPVCFVRFEKKNQEIIVGIVVDPEMQGKGIGRLSLELGIKKFREKCGDPLIAQIKKENLGSVKVFEANSFNKIQEGEILVYERKQ